MRLNVNLCRMIGAPYEMLCPGCGETFHTYFEDYDIECGRSNPDIAKWNLKTHCPHCEASWSLELHLVFAGEVSLKRY